MAGQLDLRQPLFSGGGLTGQMSPIPSGSSGGGGFLDNFGPGIADFAQGLGGFSDERAFQQNIDDIANRASFQNQGFNAGGLSGNISGTNTTGGFTGQEQMIQEALGGAGLGLLGGNTGFNTGGLNQFLGGMNIGGQFGQTAGLLDQQLGNTAFGGLGGLAGQAGQLGGMFGQQVMGGPQDFSGGLQNQLLQQGFLNQQNAGNQQGLFDQSLQSQRLAAQPYQDRQLNRLQDQLHARGQLGSTGGGQQLEGLFNAQNQQDLGFQNNAFQQAMQQQQFMGALGGQQLGQGAGFLGQNLGQFNQGAQHAQSFMGLGAGLEGQQFGQNLGALGQNQSAGLQRLQAAQGLLGLGSDIFGGAQERGLGALGLSSDRQGQARDFMLGLRNSEADRIQGAGASSQAISGAGAGGGGGFLGGLVKTGLGFLPGGNLLGGLFGG